MECSVLRSMNYYLEDVVSFVTFCKKDGGRLRHPYLIVSVLTVYGVPLTGIRRQGVRLAHVQSTGWV